MSSTQLTIAANGRIVIPAHIRTQLGLQGGEKLVARLVDGALVLEPIAVSIARAQAAVRKYISTDAALVDELILERRKSAEYE